MDTKIVSIIVRRTPRWFHSCGKDSLHRAARWSLVNLYVVLDVVVWTCIEMGLKLLKGHLRWYPGVKMDTKIVSIIVRRTPDDYTAIERTLCTE